MSGNVYATGDFKDTVDFDPSIAILNLTSNGGYDIFILKLDISGNFIWAKSIGGTDWDRGRSITTDASGDVYVTGTFEDTTDFDPGVAVFDLMSNGSSDVFSLKLDSSGDFIWAKSMGGLSNDIGTSVTTIDTGHVFVTGHYHGTADFDPGSAIFNLTSNGGFDVFIQELDAQGNFIWGTSFGAESSDYSFSIATDAKNQVYVSGSYFFTVDFDPGPVTFDMTSCSHLDVFILKLSQSIVGIAENTMLNRISIFPNPNNGLVNIDFVNFKEVSIKVYSAIGQLVYQKENIITSVHQFELIGMPGVYIVEVSSKGEKQRYKLVKN
jgi:hypothetical protein